MDLLAVIDQRTTCVLQQRRVSGDANEHKVALKVLRSPVLAGRVVTADAAFCHHEICQSIIDSGGHYVLPVKDNQPQLLAAISSEFTAESGGPVFAKPRQAPYVQRERRANGTPPSTRGTVVKNDTC